MEDESRNKEEGSDRLVFCVADAADQQVDELWAQDEPVKGERTEPLLHAPLLTGRLVRVQVWVRHVSANINR